MFLESLLTVLSFLGRHLFALDDDIGWLASAGVVATAATVAVVHARIAADVATIRPSGPAAVTLFGLVLRRDRI